MWRALFLGIGIYLMIAGAECLAVDRVVWRGGAEPRRQQCPSHRPLPSQRTSPPNRGCPGASCQPERSSASTPLRYPSGWASEVGGIGAAMRELLRNYYILA